MEGKRSSASDLDASLQSGTAFREHCAAQWMLDNLCYANASAAPGKRKELTPTSMQTRRRCICAEVWVQDDDLRGELRETMPQTPVHSMKYMEPFNCKMAKV